MSRCVDSTMGFTPLEGLVMATRSVWWSRRLREIARGVRTALA